MKNRQGSYKKILLEDSVLLEHRTYLREVLRELKTIPLSPTELTTLYLLLFLRIRHPKNWLQKKNVQSASSASTSASSFFVEKIPASMKLNDWERDKLKNISIDELFSRYNLKGIPESINRTMKNWIDGRWSIVALEYIPTSRELLKLQVKNTRCITLITDPEKIAELVFGTRDPLSFVLHDLMHADQFFSQTDSLRGQLGFYQLIDGIYDLKETKALLKSEGSFKKEFEYVASDMNAYVIHLFKCLKSSIYRTQLSEHYFKQVLLWWKMNDEQMAASYKLNTPQFELRDEIILRNFFEAQQEIIK
jgi:hypothetical protein